MMPTFSKFVQNVAMITFHGEKDVTNVILQKKVEEALEEIVEVPKEKENGEEVELNLIEEEEMVLKKIILMKKEIEARKGFVENQNLILKIEN